jgi:hypothetical protein
MKQLICAYLDATADEATPGAVEPPRDAYDDLTTTARAFRNALTEDLETRRQRSLWWVMASWRRHRKQHQKWTVLWRRSVAWIVKSGHTRSPRCYCRRPRGRRRRREARAYPAAANRTISSGKTAGHDSAHRGRSGPYSAKFGPGRVADRAWNCPSPRLPHAQRPVAGRQRRHMARPPLPHFTFGRGNLSHRNGYSRHPTPRTARQGQTRHGIIRTRSLPKNSRGIRVGGAGARPAAARWP